MVGYVESTVSLVIQIVVLSLLTGAVFLKTQKKYRQHGIVMLSAVALHIISILVVMVPSFVAYVGPGAVDFLNGWAIATLVHAFAGFVAALLGVWLVGSWRLKAEIQGCFRKKRVMDVALTLWVLTITLGILLYLVIVGLV